MVNKARSDFNPRSPCGERPVLFIFSRLVIRFQSTLSLRRATCGRYHNRLSGRISIHALLAESDRLWLSSVDWGCYFNPRSPCGERLTGKVLVRGQGISIHALLAESDPWTALLLIHTTDFNPRSPCGERQGVFFFSTRELDISIHALLAESDPVCDTTLPPCGTISIHALLAESDSSPSWTHLLGGYFNPRSPCGERQQIPPNWPYRFCLKCQFKDGEKSKKAKGSASAQASSPAYEKNKVRIPWGDFECFRFAPIK